MHLTRGAPLRLARRPPSQLRQQTERRVLCIHPVGTIDRTEPGHIGDPRHATAEKGELLFKLFADDVTAFLQRVIDWDGKSEVA